MAVAQEINLTNYATMLVQSSQGRSGSPDGNVYFNVANGTVEFITREELSQVNLGSGLEDNPLTNELAIKMEAIYAFENQERRVDEVLRQYERFTDASFKFAGAYEFVNSRKPEGSDREKIRGSGWVERALDNGVDRIYFGGRSLGNVESGSQPYYQLASGGAPSDFAKAGAVDEAVQVYGDTGNTPTDSGAGNFDTRTYYAMSVRTFGYNYDRKTLTDSGLSQADGYAAGFALAESLHLTTNAYSLADVYGGSQIAPWTGMSLEELDTPQSETGFNEADGNFTWVLHNTNNASLNECIAFLDALAQTDNDINAHATNVTNGKRVGTWYSYDAQGRIVTRSGTGSGGLFIENVPTADQQRVVFTDDASGTKTYPFQVQVEIDPGANAIADANAWYHVYYLDGSGAADYNTSGAVTVQDASSSDVKGNVATDVSGGRIIFTYDYDGNTQAGLSAGADKVIVVVVEGDGGATQQKVEATITRDAVVRITCAPGIETNV